MRLQCRYLSPSEIERIHRDSLKILEGVGVRFHSARAREILKQHGARVDGGGEIVRIPKELVDQALATAPKEFTLGARNPAFDFATGERRYAVTADLVASLRLFEELPLGTVVWPNVVLSDVPEAAGDLRTAFLSFEHSSKHIQHEIHHPAHVPYLLEGLAAILGTEAAIRERKIFSVCYCTIPPLTHDAEMCDACLELARFHVPILAYPMPAAGSTGPASLYSDIAVANAESLSALTLFQLASPGAPIICGHAAGITNFRTGGFVEGAPESNLINGALGEMARFYGLPNTQAGCLTDAQAPGAQAVLEKLLTTLPLVLSGVDLINGIGEIATSQLLVQEQILVDHEIARLCQRLRDGVEVNDAKDYFEDVARVGPGGHFLMEDHTVAACRSPEFLLPLLADRNAYERWVDLGRPELYGTAREKVAQMLAGPARNPLPEDVRERLAGILRRAETELRHA
jgi:trimethylamine--corrinoid protein Co-methyltransferase